MREFRNTNGVSCAECGEHVAHEAYLDGVGAYFCESCMNQFIREVEGEAVAYAEGHCKITLPLPRYDPTREYRCTPDEYAVGLRESYTTNAHMCSCRHNCTNYDELIKSLDRDSVRDKIYYMAIRARITDLLETAIEELACE